MAIQTSLSSLSPEQEATVVRWMTRRVQENLELDMPEKCSQVASAIWELYKASDAGFDHTATAEELVHAGPDPFSERRGRVMLQRIYSLLLDTNTVEQVVEEDQARLIAMTADHLRFETVFAIVEALTDT